MTALNYKVYVYSSHSYFNYYLGLFNRNHKEPRVFIVKGVSGGLIGCQEQSTSRSSTSKVPEYVQRWRTTQSRSSPRCRNIVFIELILANEKISRGFRYYSMLKITSIIVIIISNNLS